MLAMIYLQIDLESLQHTYVEGFLFLSTSQIKTLQHQFLLKLFLKK